MTKYSSNYHQSSAFIEMFKTGNIGMLLFSCVGFIFLHSMEVSGIMNHGRLDKISLDSLFTRMNSYEENHKNPKTQSMLNISDTHMKGYKDVNMFDTAYINTKNKNHKMWLIKTVKKILKAEAKERFEKSVKKNRQGKLMRDFVFLTKLF